MYNFDKNILAFKNDMSYDLHFKGDITIVTGNSGTGKTYLVDFIAKLKKALDKKSSKYSADNIFILDIENLSKLKSQSGKLIIIDRADVLLQGKEWVVDFINHDLNNKYLIFARGNLGIEVSPNHYATFVNSDDCITLHYEFNEWGWY